MGTDKSAKNTTNAPKLISAQIVCLSPKVWNFDEKRLHWESVVRGLTHVRVTRVGKRYCTSFLKMLDQIIANIQHFCR